MLPMLHELNLDIDNLNFISYPKMFNFVKEFH